MFDDESYPLEPPLTPPFAVLRSGDWFQLMDQECRVIMESTHGEFVRELAGIMNENQERLVHKWNLDS